MEAYKTPTFGQRQAAAAEAKKKALDALKTRPPVDEAILAARREAAAKREAAEAEKRAAKKAAAEEAKAARAAAAAATIAKDAPVQLTEAERKAERDRRYAERKARK